MVALKKLKLGEILKQLKLIDELQLQSAIAHHQQWGMPLGRALVEKGFVRPEQVLEALAKQTGLPWIDLDQVPLDPDLGVLISQRVAEQHRVVPLRLEGARQETLVVAIAAPADLSALDAVRAVSKKSRVEPILAWDEAIERAIRWVYSGENVELQAAASPIGTGAGLKADEQEFDPESLRTQAPNPPATAPQPASDANGSVFLYGWPEGVGQAMAQALQAQNVAAQVVAHDKLVGARAKDVAVMPLPSAEALIKAGVRCNASLVVAGKNPEADVEKARAMGARSYITAPVDLRRLLQAIQQVQRGPAARA